MSSTQDVRFSWGAIEEGQKLANKLWNVARLILQQAGGRRAGAAARRRSRSVDRRPDRRDAGASSRSCCRASTSRTSPTRSTTSTFDDFCDWYAEAIKPRLYADDAAAIATALAALERLLALLHPVMPHVTEEIWSQFHDGRLILGRGRSAGDADPAAGGDWSGCRSAAATFRRSGVAASSSRATRSGSSTRSSSPSGAPRSTGDVEAERSACAKEIARAEGMLANERFVANAPPDVVEAEREKLERYRRELEALGDESAPAGSRALSPWPEEFGLERMRALLAALGDPQRALPGDARRRHERQDVDDADDRGAPRCRRAPRRAPTSRRTSAAGRERIQVDGGTPTSRRRSRAFGRTPQARRSSRCSRRRRSPSSPPARVDAAVVEAGLGGRHDATNVLDARVVVLTNVALEHTDVLGDTREAIAAEKLAVVRPGAHVVLGEPEWEPAATAAGARSSRSCRGSNLALAVAAAEAFLGRAVDPTAAEAVQVPGRLERRGERPLEIWDGAHNLAGIGYLLPRVPARRLHDRRLDPRRQGCRGDAPRAHRARPRLRRDPVARTPARSRPPSSPTSPSRTSRASRPSPTRPRRLARARELAGPDGAVLVTGSLYLLAELSADA